MKNSGFTRARGAVIGALTVCASVLITVGVGTTAGAAGLGGGYGSSHPRPLPASIPVLDWHELNNSCDPTAATCDGPDPESVTTAQMTAELSYLAAQGYQTITPIQYLAWTMGFNDRLPAHPVFLVGDNGIENLLAGAAPILRAQGDSMSVAVVTGFADGASGICPEPQFEPGCPADNQDGNWDATWSQLQALPRSTFNFIVESGAAGHFVQSYDPNCTAFYACKVPGESDAAYEARVVSELSTANREIQSKLGSRYTPGLWVVPYSDAGYTPCAQLGCTPQPSDGPAGWLSAFAASHFGVAFVEDAFRNGVQNEHFRIDVQGWMTETEFEQTLTGDLAAGDFLR